MSMLNEPTERRSQGAADFLIGGGAMGARMRAHDWSQTPLGPPERWPQALRSALGICLNSAYPIALYWGSELAVLYNDAWSPIPGNKHPWALGRPGREVWPEIWANIGPLFERVEATGEGVWMQDEFLPMRRHGYTEECYFNFTFSPIRGESGRVEGIFNAVVETTYRVLSERRSRVLRNLAEHMAGAESVQQAGSLAAESLATAAADLPFALLYLLDPETGTARLAGAAGLPVGGPASPARISLEDGASEPWPLAEVVRSGEPVTSAGLIARFGGLPGGPWEDPADMALVLPVARAGQERPFGMLVAGISPRRSLDEEYRGFLELVAAQIATAVGSAREYEQERRRAQALAELDRAKTAFFSNVSHEFRTPLTLMLGPVEDLLSGVRGRLEPGQRAELEVAHRNALRLLKLVNTLLDFSRIEAGRVEAWFEATDLTTYTAELASTFRSAVERAGLRLVVHTPPLPHAVYVDPDMWEKIVLNLLSNAFKYTLEGEIEVHLTPTPGGVELRVRDTGSGIPASELPHIFERFHRVKETRGRTHEGTGIGLAMVHELVRLHGGTIIAESVEGAGSTFRVHLPVGTAHLPPERIRARPGDARPVSTANAYLQEAMRWLPDAPDTQAEELPASSDATAIPLPLLSGARIVLADDNADMREYVARLLSQQRYTVEAVADGAAALDAARREVPDLLISDVMMPGMDGFELLEALRADARTRDVPIVLLSARAGEDARIEGLTAGADDYLVKPFSARELVARVNTHLEMARMRREAHAALRRSEQEFVAIFNQAGGGIARSDLTGRFTLVNDRYCEIVGRSREELMGLRMQDITHPDDLPRNLELLEGAIARGGRFSVDKRYLRPDGSSVWVTNEVSIIEDADGAPRSILAVSHDVTERKRSEEERQRLTALLEAEKARLQEIVLTAPAVIATLRGPDHVYESANPRYLELVGARPLVGLPIREALPELESQGVFELLDQVYRSGEAVTLDEFEVSLTSPGEASRDLYFNFVYQPLREADGSVTGILVHAVDVTAQVQARHQVEHARQAAEEANQAKASFLATMSHELRTPLNAIIGYTDLLEIGVAGPINEAQGAQLRRITSGAKHLLQLIEELLTFSRIEAGRMEIHLAPVEIHEIVHDTAALIAPLARAKGLEFDSDLPETGAVITTDEGKVRQILINLLGNGIKFTDAGRVSLRARMELDEAVFEVSDTGIGIAAADAEKIFEPFQQVSRGMTRHAGGTGLGLSVSRQLARLLGGDVTVESQPGRGSTFTVRLPRTTTLAQ